MPVTLIKPKKPSKKSVEPAFVRCFIAERRTYNVGRLAYLMLRLCDGKFLFIQKINPFHLMLNQFLNNGLSIIQS